MRQPGNGLLIRAAPLHAAGPNVTAMFDDSAGHQDYPSYVDVPTPGCWHVTLAWGGHTASLDLDYSSR